MRSYIFSINSEEQHADSKVSTIRLRSDGGAIVGFGDMDSSGYLDRLYVHKAYQRRGIASAICGALEQTVRGKRIITHASITAKPFFLHRGYRVVREQKVVRQGVALTNYVMEKPAQAAGIEAKE